jgi:UDP-N-acetylmuramoyl-tripeptide--D-alanyl-D-alanine ligase
MTPFQVFLAMTKKRLAALAFLPVVAAAVIWRRTVLRKTTVVAVTGSVGKTTAKECLVAILRQSRPVTALPGASNGRFGLPLLLLRGRPPEQILVAEVGNHKKGRMWRSAFLLKPNVAVITRVNWQHAVNFRSLEEIAEQKAKVLDPLGPNGLAILNADDARVAAMAHGRDCRVRTFGLDTGADVVGEVAVSRWPDRFAVTVRANGESHRLQTRLVGDHWATSVLAAVTAARALGASWQDCAAGLLSIDPYPGRLNSIKLPNGADMLRDEYNGSFATLETALEIVAQARCQRRVIAIGHVLDAPQFKDSAAEEAAKRCAAVGDLLLFWGRFAARYQAAALKAGTPAENIFVFQTQVDMAQFIRRETKPGDLILLKGYWFDHMSRVVFTQFGSVACQLEKCLKHSVCDRCSKLEFRPDAHVEPALVEPLLAGQARIAAP